MRKMNHMLYTVFFFQFCLISCWATLSLLWMQDNRDTHTYLDIQGEMGVSRWFIQYMTY